MAVYERSYRPYEGPLTGAWSRLWVLPRYAYENILRSRGFVAFAVFSGLAPAAAAVLIYLHHNLYALKALHLDAGLLAERVPINGLFFMILIAFQGFLAFILALVMGPSLMVPDFANNGLALYLCRPFSKWEYILGRFTALAVLMSAITWVPGLILFVFQSFLGGWSWFAGNAFIAWGIVAGSMIWIVLVCLVTMAASAWVRRKPLAAALVLGFFFVSRAMAGAITEIYRTWVGDLFNPWGLTRTVWAGLFNVNSPTHVPVALAWTDLVLLIGLCLWLLSRKVKAYQVVR